MNTAKTIAKNTGVLTISHVITSILGFFLLIYTARYLGEVGFGKYRFAMSVTALFAIFANLGINNYIIREIARNKELTNEYLSNISVIKLLLSFLAFGSIALTINLMDYPEDTTYAVYLFGMNYRSRITDYGLHITDHVLQIPCPKSLIRAYKKLFCKQKPLLKMLMQQSFRKSLIKNAALQSSQNCSH